MNAIKAEDEILWKIRIPFGKDFRTLPADLGALKNWLSLP